MSGGGRTGKRSWFRGETVDDAALLQVVRGHLYLDPVAGQDADFVDTHAAGEMAQEFMILGFVGSDADAESGVRVTFFNNANELNDILGHK